MSYYDDQRRYRLEQERKKRDEDTSNLAATLVMAEMIASDNQLNLFDTSAFDNSTNIDTSFSGFDGGASGGAGVTGDF